MNFQEMSQLLIEKGIRIDPSCEAKFQTYAALLKEWNERMNLTSIVEEAEVYEKHFYDSLLIAHDYELKGKKIADIPVETCSLNSIVINTTEAAKLGIGIPDEVLAIEGATTK